MHLFEKVTIQLQKQHFLSVMESVKNVLWRKKTNAKLYLIYKLFKISNKENTVNSHSGPHGQGIKNLTLFLLRFFIFYAISH